MKVTFDGIELSTDSFSSGETWASTFTIQGSQTNQTSRPARSEYVRYYSRALRSHTISITFIPPPAVDYDTAAEALGLYFSELPQQGDLVILSGTRELTFPDACVESFAPPPRNGVSLVFPVRFIAGAVTQRTRSLLGTLNPMYPNVIQLTGLTGGGANNLDGLATTDVEPGRMVDFYLVSGSGLLIPHRWVLVAWTDQAEDAAGGVVLPDDFDSGTNAKVWQRLL